ncbi:hypothetical protein K435DRAFT_862586 [Dendrothele bispora CBS 962.96]|uniref:Oxidase ustYa n=1 Tax=Dendrothele bispora (strain CBS 962.96) TaxID=1314807 RepID=A0A4S8LS71_DENBC|nr:hypothetical protein K435DRAFT_862586 [Dendrothele bispora CBS 962.96]
MLWSSSHSLTAWTFSGTTKYSYVAHDFPFSIPITGENPQRVRLTVEESANYPLSGWDSDDVWRSLGSNSAGYVRLGPLNRLFTLTMFHEMHCLRMLNLAFDPSNILSDDHITHCLGYLRQQVLCHPDLTLEPAGWQDRDLNSGEGATHLCWDWEAVYRLVDDNWSTWKRTREELVCDNSGVCVE